MQFEIIVRAIIRQPPGKVLLVKRAKKPAKGKWILPGGKVEFKETAMDAVKREIKEELNLDFKPTFLFYKDDFTSVSDKHCLVLYFRGVHKGKIFTKPDEITDYGYFTKAQIETTDNIGFDHKIILLDYFLNK